MTKMQVFALVITLSLGLSYMLWLDAGCGALGGAMTWTGKVCVSSL